LLTVTSLANWHSQDFSVSREDAGRVPVLVVRGGIDAQTGPELSAAVCAFGSEKVVVDLREVDYIDDDGLHDLLLASRVVAVGLHVVCPRGCAVRGAFVAAGKLGRLTIHESRVDALGTAGAAARPHPAIAPAARGRLTPRTAL
jgi:anti-anti-sigma regulatory factor